MASIDWFIKKMEKTFHTFVIIKDIGYESNEFEHDEIDDLLIPEEHLIKLPDPLTLQTFSYIDNKGYEWIAGLVEDEGKRQLLYEVWFRNGQKIAYEIYVD
jgi:hypothetical protein